MLLVTKIATNAATSAYYPQASAILYKGVLGRLTYFEVGVGRGGGGGGAYYRAIKKTSQSAVLFELASKRGKKLNSF